MQVQHTELPALVDARAHDVALGATDGEDGESVTAGQVLDVNSLSHLATGRSRGRKSAPRLLHLPAFGNADQLCTDSKRSRRTEYWRYLCIVCSGCWLLFFGLRKCGEPRAPVQAMPQV